jgi:hypothetical protein
MWKVLTTKYARAELILDFSKIETDDNKRALAPGEDPDLLKREV